MEAGSEIYIPYVKYWLALHQSDVGIPEWGNPLTPHTAWGLSDIKGYDGENDLYIFLLVDPQRYMLACVKYGW